MTDTLVDATHFESEVRRSRFLAQAGPAATPESALGFLAAVARRDATHNCWAFRIGPHYRFNDDGEPGGTAGRPILAAIEAQGFDQVMVVVTRWFGGVKLGAGGLARAYGGAAAECLRRATRRALVTLTELRVRIGFPHLGAAHALFAEYGAEKLHERFGSEGLELSLRLPADQVAALILALRDATRGQARVECVGAPPAQA